MTQSQTDRDRILDLDDLAEESPDGVKIAGEFYPYINVQSWGLRQRSRFGGLKKRIDEIEQIPSAKMSEITEAEYEKLTREAIKMIVLGIPDEIVRKLNDGKRTTLMMDFLIKSGVKHPLFNTITGLNRTMAESSLNSTDIGPNPTLESGSESL